VAALAGEGTPSGTNKYTTKSYVDSGLGVDIAIGDIPYDANGSYFPDIGLTKDVSAEIPAGFNLVAVVATGYKANQMTGARQDEPPLTLEPKVYGTDIEIRVWDASGDEYGGANWSSMSAHIDYTLFIKK
jgi:hypothetical protein